MKMIKNEKSYMFKDDDGKIASRLNYYNYKIKNFDWILIANLITIPKYRRQGLATKLVNAICKDMNEKNKGVYLSVNVNNSNAIKLYEDLSFKKIKRYKSEGKEYIIMAKGNADMSQLHNMNFA